MKVLQVPLLSPRQVGKTILALTIGETRPSIYVDLQSEADRARLSEPELNLASHGDKLVILDDVHRLPNVFQILRGSVDHNRPLDDQFLPYGGRRRDRSSAHPSRPKALGNRDQAKLVAETRKRVSPCLRGSTAAEAHCHLSRRRLVSSAKQRDRDVASNCVATFARPTNF